MFGLLPCDRSVEWETLFGLLVDTRLELAGVRLRIVLLCLDEVGAGEGGEVISGGGIEVVICAFGASQAAVNEGDNAPFWLWVVTERVWVAVVVPSWFATASSASTMASKLSK